MRNMQRKLGVATGEAGVLLSMLAAGTAAAEDARPAGSGLEEIPDDELGDMRGRYVVSDTSVAWFGVTMISTWQTSSGQILQGQLQLVHLRGVIEASGELALLDAPVDAL